MYFEGLSNMNTIIINKISTRPQPQFQHFVITQCSCGWHFYKRFENDTQCPQCRPDPVIRCGCCGVIIKKYRWNIKHCKSCQEIVTKLLDKERNKNYKVENTSKLRETIIASSIQMSDILFNGCGKTADECLKCEKAVCVYDEKIHN